MSHEHFSQTNDEQAIHAEQGRIPPEAIAKCERFLEENASSLGSMFGLRHINIRPGKGWAVNLETGEVTADPRFFLERDYTPDMSIYAITHEIAAHLREVEFMPSLNRQVINFAKDKDPQLGQAKQIFHNILSDIAGNKLIHAVLPSMENVAAELYSQKLFPEDDYTERPRHLQFLYKVIRDEMVPGSSAIVTADVAAMLDEFRNFQGEGDLIAYSTQVAKSRREAMPNEEKFALWTKVIYPRWKELYDMDEQDPKFQNHDDTQNDENKDQSQNDSDGGGQDQEQEKPSSRPNQAGKPDFSEHYQQYWQDIEPRPISDETIDEIKTVVKQQTLKETAERRQAERTAAEKQDPATHLNEQILRETGHTLEDKRAYDRTIREYIDQIAELREVFRSILNEQVAYKQQLRGNHIEGVMPNPETLVQTHIDVQTGHFEPPAYVDYEKHEMEREITGKTDYVFVFDRSGSMEGSRSQAAGAAMVVCLEALAKMEEDIIAAEKDHNLSLAIDIRTAVYTFDSDIEKPKQLGTGLSDKERFDSYGLVTNPTGTTADYLALQDLLATYPKNDDTNDRKRFAIIVSDGASDNELSARKSIDQLRKEGWNVYGISIASDAAVQLYAPYALRIDKPSQLPTALKSLIEKTLA